MADFTAAIEAAHGAAIGGAFAVLVAALADNRDDSLGAATRFAKAVSLANQARELAFAAVAPAAAERAQKGSPC